MSPLKTPLGVESVLSLTWGTLRLRTLTLALPDQFHPATIAVELDGHPLQTNHSLSHNRLTLTLPDTLQLTANQKLKVSLA
jgi:hypothetical protein